MVAGQGIRRVSVEGRMLPVVSTQTQMIKESCCTFDRLERNGRTVEKGEERDGEMLPEIEGGACSAERYC